MLEIQYFKTDKGLLLNSLAGYPDTGNFKPTTQNLLNLARITIEG